MLGQPNSTLRFFKANPNCHVHFQNINKTKTELLPYIYGDISLQNKCNLKATDSPIEIVIQRDKYYQMMNTFKYFGNTVLLVIYARH